MGHRYDLALMLLWDVTKIFSFLDLWYSTFKWLGRSLGAWLRSLRLLCGQGVCSCLEAVLAGIHKTHPRLSMEPNELIWSFNESRGSYSATLGYVTLLGSQDGGNRCGKIYGRFRLPPSLWRLYDGNQLDDWSYTDSEQQASFCWKVN